jgi:hypothetical protein
MLYTSPWSRFEFTTSVVIATDYIGSCKFNYHTIAATTILIKKIVYPFKTSLIAMHIICKEHLSNKKKWNIGSIISWYISVWIHISS